MTIIMRHPMGIGEPLLRICQPCFQINLVCSRRRCLLLAYVTTTDDVIKFSSGGTGRAGRGGGLARLLATECVPEFRIDAVVSARFTTVSYKYF